MKVNSQYAISFNQNYDYNSEETIGSHEKSANEIIYQPVTLSNFKIGKAMRNIALFTLPATLTCATGCYVSPDYIEHPIEIVRAAVHNENMTVGNIKIENIKADKGSLLSLRAKINGKPTVIEMQSTQNSITGNVGIVQDDNSLKRYPLEINALQKNLFEAEIGDKKATILYGEDGKCKILDDKGKEIEYDLPIKVFNKMAAFGATAVALLAGLLYLSASFDANES